MKLHVRVKFFPIQLRVLRVSVFKTYLVSV
jgi:hypothetical protein